VANTGENKVSVINSDTNTVVTNISVGTYPTGVAYNSANDKIYVANRDSNSISVINGITNTILKTINVPPLPLSLAVNPNTNTIYVVHTQPKTPEANNTTPNTISVIDGDSNTLTKKVILTARPEAMAVNLKNNILYVTNPGNRSVPLIDGKTNQVMQISPPEYAKFMALVDLLLVTIIPIILIVFILLKRSRRFVKNNLINLYNKARDSEIWFLKSLKKLVQLVRKSWIRSGLVLTILSLIVMPILVVLSQIHVDQITNFFRIILNIRTLYGKRPTQLTRTPS
jgi:YVTN family beta-propeller protein